MTVFRIADINNSALAIEWCMKHVPKSDWNVISNWPGTGYDFQIANPELATIFGLKWAGAV